MDNIDDLFQNGEFLSIIRSFKNERALSQQQLYYLAVSCDQYALKARRRSHYQSMSHRYFRRLSARSPADLDVKRAYSMLLLHEGRLGGAFRIARNLYERSPSGNNALALGNIYRARGYSKKAIALYKKSFRNKSVRVQAATTLAMTYFQNENYSEAKKWAEKALGMINKGIVKIPPDRIRFLHIINMKSRDCKPMAFRSR